MKKKIEWRTLQITAEDVLGNKVMVRWGILEGIIKVQVKKMDNGNPWETIRNHDLILKGSCDDVKAYTLAVFRLKMSMDTVSWQHHEKAQTAIIKNCMEILKRRKNDSFPYLQKFHKEVRSEQGKPF